MTPRLLVFFMFWSVSCGAEWLDRSQEIFLPSALRQMASAYRDFPIFWWNFLVVEGPVSDEGLASLCAGLVGPDIQKLPCNFDLKNVQGLTADWLRDLPLREDAPANLHAALAGTLVKASLPMGRELVEILRLDPLNSLKDLQQRVEKRLDSNFHLERGVYRASGKSLLPLQFSFSPADSERTGRLQKKLARACAGLPGCAGLTLFGPHASSAENEAQIRADVNAVSRVGSAALIILALFLLFSGRARVLYLLPLLGLCVGLAVGVTIWVFGSIHGLTLAFGPGIVGLAMDYGIHSCFLGPRSRKTWRANFVGLLTTIVIMIVLGFSAIPLLRQMMFFATFGICLSYAAFYLALRRWPALFAVRTYNFTPARLRGLGLLGLLFLVAWPLLIFIPVHLDVQHFNFESAKTAELRTWFFARNTSPAPYLLREDAEDPLGSSWSRRTWSEAHGLPFEGLAGYLPLRQQQEAHLATWSKTLCSAPAFQATPTERKFFAPFWPSVACGSRGPVDLTRDIPGYVKDFAHGGEFVALLFAKDEAQTRLLRQEFPQATTPREIFDRFPEILMRELRWMVPLAFLGALFFLWRHYRHVGWALLAVVPFFTGLGCFALACTIFRLPVSFISLIGLLMVFGCSLDYGVFVMDFLLYRREDQPGVWSALSVCAFATLAGFAPLVFARHPVLQDLGQALLWGTFGTYIGAIWGVTSVHALTQRWRA